MKTLKKPYLQIRYKDQMSYGGNQTWFEKKFMKKSACGVIGAADVLLHMRGKTQMTESEYMEFAKKLWKGYLPVIPGFGMNGLTLMLGLNGYFIKKKMPYRAYWNVSGRKKLAKIDQMLSKDIPVIFSVGPNFPNFRGKATVRLYIKNSDGNYGKASKVRSHYMIVTGRDGSYLQLSSWGKEYYINYAEYQDYIKQYSSHLVSNIVCIKELKKLK